MRRMYSKPQLLEAVEQEAEVNGLKAFENIVDKDGHKRFIEGDGNAETITGLTQTYLKWSLCGTHLLFVNCGKIDDTTVLPWSLIAKYEIPEWVYDKLVPLTTGTNYLDNKLIACQAENYSNSQNMTFFIQKALEGTKKLIYIYASGMTATADRFYRVSFDFLIDND